MGNAQTNKDVAMRYVEELWSGGKLEVADEIISASPETGSGSNSGGLGGPEGVKAMVGGVRQLLSEVSRQIHSITADDAYVAINSTVSGIHANSWGPIPYPPTGEEISISGLAVFKFADDQIIDEPWSNWNLSDHDQQDAVAIVNRLIASACVRKFVSGAWEENDPESILNFIAEDVTINTPWSDVPITSRDEFARWINSFHAENPNFKLESTVHTNHDNGVTVFRTWNAENIDGNPTGMGMTRFENGLIVEDHMGY